MSRSMPVAVWRLLREADALLTWTGALMLIALAATIAGLWLDPRTIGGAPAWLKPAKFAASTAIYSFTLAWILGWLHAWPRVRRIASRLTATVFVLEVSLVSLQAARGTTSHFNVATPLDSVLFNVMGAAIVLQTITMLLVLAALWRERFADESMGWALRLGLLVAIVGAFTGGVMTRPTADQLAEAGRTGHMTVAGAHTVGAPDGGAGLPITGWSRTHGDLRIAHFVGLHAMQILPAYALLPGIRRRRPSDRIRLVLAATAAYAGLYVLLFVQALRGQSIAAPDPFTLTLTAAWLAVALALISAASPLRRARTSPSYSPGTRRFFRSRGGPAAP